MSLFAARINALNALNSFNRGTTVVSRNIDKSYDIDYHRIKDSTKKDASFGQLIPTEITRANNTILSEKLLEAVSLREQSRIEIEISNRLGSSVKTDDGNFRIVEAYENLVEHLEDVSKNGINDESHIIINEDFEDFYDAIIDMDRVANDVTEDIGRRLDIAIDEVNVLISEVAQLNSSIASTPKNTITYASLEDRIESKIKDMSSYMNIKIFRDKDTGIYNIYSANADLFIVNTEVGVHLGKVTDVNFITPALLTFTDNYPEIKNFRIINTFNNSDISNNISQGIIKALQSTGKSQVDNAIKYADGFLKALSTRTNYREVSTSQGFPDATRFSTVSSLRQGLNTGGFSSTTIKQQSEYIFNSISNGDHVKLTEIFNPAPLPQVYVPAQLTFNQQPFFIDYGAFAIVYKNLKRQLESSVGQQFVNLSFPNPSLNQAIYFVREYQGQSYSNFGFDISVSNARSDVEQLFRVMDNLLRQEVAIPDNLIHAHNLKAYTQSTGAIIQPPAPRALPSFDNELTLASVKTMITNIEGYLNNYPNDPTQALLNHYNNWHEYQRHEFHYLLHEIDTITGTRFENTPANLRPLTLGLSEKDIKTILSRLKDHITPSINDGPAGTTFMEKYWYKKIFHPEDTKTNFPRDINAKNVKLNKNSLSLVKDLLNDDRKLNKLISHFKSGILRFYSLDVSFVTNYRGVFQNMNRDVTSIVTNSENIYETYSDLASVYSEILSNEVGVNIDEEVNRLTTLQSSYAASARSISAINEMFEALIKSVEV